MTLLEFCRKYSVRLNNEIDKTIKKGTEFYKNKSQVHDKFQISLATMITNRSNKDQHLAYLRDRLQEDAQYIQKIEFINE